MKFYNKLSPLYKRLFWGKIIGLIMSLVGFIYLSILDKENQFTLLSWGILLWYPTIGGIIGLMGIIKKLPVFNLDISYCRGIFVGAFMNFVLALWAVGQINEMINVIFGYNVSIGYTFVMFIVEGAVVGFIIDYIVTKKFGEGKNLLK